MVPVSNIIPSKRSRVLRLVNRTILFLGCVLFHSQMIHSQGLEVESSFSTAETTVGREVTYTITIRKGEDVPDLVLKSPVQPVLPRTSALAFGRFQTSEQYLSSVGDDPVSITLEFEVVTKIEGRVIMPSFVMDYMGRQLRIPAAALKVRSPEEDLTGGEIDWFFFELSEVPDTLNVGQRYKTVLNLYVFKGLRNVTFANPEPVGSDFSMGAISPGPTERVVTRGLYRYSVYGWPLTFSPIRSGKIGVSFKVNLNFRIPNDRLEFIRAARANTAESQAIIETLLQDSREESQVVFSENFNLEVESLPEPESKQSFYHAIGKYELRTLVDKTKIEVGEPINYTIEISGEGNFGSLKTPRLELDKRWRVFEPQESFEDKDFLGYKGVLTYRYVLIPLSNDVRQVSSFDYTFFDVSEKVYKTLSSEPISIEMLGVSIVSKEDIDEPEVKAQEPDEVEVSLNSSLRWDLGRSQVLGQPFFRRLEFYWLQLFLLLVFAVFIYLRLRKLKIERDHAFARQLLVHSWIRKYVRLAGIAAKEEDSEQFYESAFLAFCAVVASSSTANVEAITVEDVQFCLAKMDLNDNVKRVIEGYLKRYEQHRFSGTSLETPPLTHEFDRLKSILKKFDNQLGQVSEV